MNQISTTDTSKRNLETDYVNFEPLARSTDTVRREPQLATQSVPALEKALSILEMLAGSRAGFSLAEIVKRSGLPKSSVHCILLTLQRQGYLYRNESTGRYLFSLKLFSLANMALSSLRLREQAAPHLHALMRETRLTAHMAILEQNEAVLVAKVEGPAVSRMATWLGKRMELHCTGLGKALASVLPPERLETILKERGLPRHNENTIATAKRFKEDLAKAAKCGYAIDDEEDEIGLRCIGAPVFDQDGSVIAAISIAGTTTQITAENVGELASHVKNTAAAISRILGHNAEIE
jgi:DNA-binding IclR family transcriptional regulator